MLPTFQEYQDALKIISAYEKGQRDLVNERLKEAKKELAEFFKTTYIKEYQIRCESSFLGGDRFKIIPIEPEFDEDYSGEFDKDINVIALKFDISLSMDSGIYSK